MKPLYLFLSLFAGLSSFHSYALMNEPSTSLMANSHWVKVRVHDDAIYEVTYDELRNLGFANPERVNVFGYNPTLLLTHNENKIPADLSPVYTFHATEQNKILFYGKGDTDFAPELWKEPATGDYHHSKHSYSPGAAYFLSDAECELPQLPMADAPLSITGSSILTSHTSLIYYEDDAHNIAEGGSWFAGPLINNSQPSETHFFEVKKLVSDKAEVMYSSLMSPETKSDKNFLLASYGGEITSEESTGFPADALSSHALYTRSIRSQNIRLPLQTLPATYSVTFSVHPEASKMENAAMLDFFAVKYNRSNDVADDNQVRMYFENTQTAQIAKFDGMGEGDWQVWNVNVPLSPVRLNLLQENNKYYCNISKATAGYPNEIIAFNVDETQLSPEIVGVVPNQNLHAMNVPDMVIVTTKILLPSAEKIAALHKRLQGLDVAVVDQQQIFNEYSSGNISAEGVRRFANHLYLKDSEKFKGMLLLGPGTYDQPSKISDDAAYVVTAQCELYISATKLTTAFASDTFFGSFGVPVTSLYWGSRGSQLQIIANKQQIAVGRVPLSSLSEIDAYYKKVEEYLTTPDNYGGLGNILLASDYSEADEEHHLSNAEAIALQYADKAGTTITVNRVSSNLVSLKNNHIVKTSIESNINSGVSFFAYFGHGNPSNIGGTSGTNYFFDLNSAMRMLNKGKYPIVYFGSCAVGPFDRSSNNLSNKFLANANGGAICVIASGREVYQKQNQELCQRFVKHMLASEDGSWLGSIYAKAQQECISAPNATRDNIINHLTYNFLGDPALPYRAETHSVALSVPEKITMLTDNTLSGTVLNADGEVDTDFNGAIKLTIYDVPELRKNILGTNVSDKYTYYPEITLDQDVIGEATADVVNGVFEASFVGPATVKQGTHRLQAYAYSNDGRKRGLGYIENVSFAEPEVDIDITDKAPTAIRSFVFDNDMLVAEIYIPSGLAQSSATKSSILLMVDGKTISRVQNFATHEHGDICKITYPVRTLTHGRHTAHISVLDARNEWTDAECVFGTTSIPQSSLSAAVDNGKVNFELISALPGNPSKRLIVEHLNGDLAYSGEMSSSTEAVVLPAGAYRAYVMLNATNSASSTPKIEIIVD